MGGESLTNEAIDFCALAKDRYARYMNYFQITFNNDRPTAICDHYH